MSLTNSKQTAREIAKDFIRPYVLRGDPVEWIADGMGGCFCTHYGVQIGGYAVLTHGREMDGWESIKLGRFEIAVTQINGVECLRRFNLKELYAEILAGSKQLSLLEGGDER